MMDDLSLELIKKKLEKLDSDLEITIRILKNLPKQGITHKTNKDLLGSYKRMKEEIEFYLADLEQGEEWKKGTGP